MFSNHLKLIESSPNSIYFSHLKLLFLRLACTLSPLLYKCSVSVLKYYHNTFHPWCEGGLQLADIGTNNVSEPDLTPIMKYIMVRI